MTSGSLDGALGSATFSRAFILLFCSFISNSTLKNPAQYNRIDKTEMMEAKEGKFCFWAVISMISTARPSVQYNVCWILLQPDMWYSRHERGWCANFMLFIFLLILCETKFKSVRTNPLNWYQNRWLGARVHEGRASLEELGDRQLSFRTRETRALQNYKGIFVHFWKPLGLISFPENLSWPFFGTWNDIFINPKTLDLTFFISRKFEVKIPFRKS